MINMSVVPYSSSSYYCNLPGVAIQSLPAILQHQKHFANCRTIVEQAHACSKHASSLTRVKSLLMTCNSQPNLESRFEGVHVGAAPHNAHLPCLTGDLLPLNRVDLRVALGVLASALGSLVPQWQHNLRNHQTSSDVQGCTYGLVCTVCIYYT